MKISLIVSTYNWPEALAVVFKSILHQKQLPAEIIIADDGSSSATKELIANFKKSFTIPLKHVWHDDKGFRKATILNNAISEAIGEYIIQIDGDCILHKNFIGDHVEKIEKGTYLFGTKVNIKEEAVSNILNNQIVDFAAFDKVLVNKTESVHSSFAGKVSPKKNIVSSKYYGCNISFFKSDFEAINGYDEDFEGWGREDSELAQRLHNFGLKGKMVRFSAIVYHLHHKKQSESQLKLHNYIEEKTIIEKKIWTKNGYNKYIKYKEYTKKDVCVIIPIYKSDLTTIEKISLERCLEIFSEYNIYFIQPNKLDATDINFSNKIKSEKFNDNYFNGILGYNKLLMSNELYSRFSDYKYMLIYQLDCYVFSDRLLYWCNKGYDYIGAPWIASRKNVINKLISKFDNINKKRRSKIFFKVGNGGFSLRKIDTFKSITKEYKDVIDKELQRDTKDYRLMEDVFWSFKASELRPSFKIPHYKVALKFSMDRKPQLALKQNKNRLPFGCHGINKPKVINFWKKIIPEMSHF